MHKSALFLCLALLVARPGTSTALPPYSSPQRIAVKIHNNVEMLGFVYFLGYLGREIENDPNAQRRALDLKKYAYGYHLYQQYKSHATSPHLATIMALAGDIGTDYFTSLLVQLDDFPNASLKEDIPASYYARFAADNKPGQARQHAVRFIDAMNQLYREVNFEVYLRQNRHKYENALAQVRNRLPATDFIPALEKFYGRQFGSYTLIPSLTVPAGMGFGVRHAVKGKTHIFNVFGAFDIQQFGDDTRLDMGFANERRLRELSTHEFGHSFVNPVIDQLPEALITGTERLFEPIKAEMTGQGYNTWKSCLYEHFVRAGEVVIAHNLNHAADAEQLRKDYEENRKFIYLPILVEALQQYNRGEVPSYPEAVEGVLKKLKSKAEAR